MRKLSFLFVGALGLSIVALANTTAPASCSPPAIPFSNGTGGPTPVSCPAFSVPGATLTGVTLTFVADYQFGNKGGSTDVAVVFVPAGPGGVTWTPSSVQLDVLNDAAMDGSSGAEPSGTSSATAGVSTAAFAAAFNVNLTSSVPVGSVLTSSGAVTIVYTYTPAPALTLTCPASTGTVGVFYSSALVASGGVPGYTFSITGGSLSPLTLNPSTGAITGTPTTAGPLTFTAMVMDSVGTTAGTTPTTCTITIATAPPPPPPGVCNASTPVFSPGVAGAFQVRYAANLNFGDSFVDFTNSGATVVNGASSNLCANVYTFDPAEELISCCSCLVTPNGLQSLSVLQSLISNPLTPAVPTSVVIKVVGSVPVTGALGGALLAWGTTLHAGPTSPPSFGLTEGPFARSDLSAAELSHITSTCGFIQANGSGFGICKGCAAGGLGASISTQ
jgi:hypothetical protein